MYFFLTTCKFIELGNLSKIDIGVCLIASACHDHEHPGLNNLYQINCKTQLAWTYNDKSPLENHHLYSSFSALKNPDCNIFEKFEKP
jgi:cAMP-specific phosphodiesterase 4/calcium/calmodulin-dependent 3',5'-cyclic nucleotide phosphodiesterase